MRGKLNKQQWAVRVLGLQQTGSSVQQSYNDHTLNRRSLSNLSKQFKTVAENILSSESVLQFLMVCPKCPKKAAGRPLSIVRVYT